MKPDFYNRSIDGLRGVAVLLVCFYHFEFQYFKAGFIGVDIFFVISGYVITNQILILSGKLPFNLKIFLNNRCRRLLPALFLVLIVISFLQLLVDPIRALPPFLNNFGESLISQIFFIQNFYYLVQGEYFFKSDSKPLLHTWSLGLEFQFYLLLPLVFICLHKPDSKKLIYVLGFFFATSFLLMIYLANVSPKISFYSTPTRAWQFLSGALLALVVPRLDMQHSSDFSKLTIIKAFGLTIIIASLVFISPDRGYPDFYALAPVLGTILLLIVFIGDSSKNSSLFSSSLLVLLGKLSYSLYLWHWPLVVLLKQIGFELNFFHALLVFALSLILSMMTYFFIERPIRKGTLLSNRVFWTITLCSGVSIFAIGLMLISTMGASYRFNPDDRLLAQAPLQSDMNRCGIIFRAINPLAPACEITNNLSTNKRVLLWGNSHADQYTSMLRDLAKLNNTALFLNAKNCRAIPDHSFCNRQTQAAIIDFINQKRITDVVLASTGYGSYGVSDLDYEREMKSIVTKLSGSGLTVWLVVDIPQSISLDPEYALMNKFSASNDLKIARSDYESEIYAREYHFFRQISLTTPRVNLIDPSLNLCDSLYCYGAIPAEVWYRDSNHLTLKGAQRVAEQFKRVFY